MAPACHACTHTSICTHANTHSCRLSQIKVFLTGGVRGGWVAVPVAPLCRCVSTCQPHSQFGCHEIDVRFDQREERQAPLELRHVLNHRRLQRNENRSDNSHIFTLYCTWCWNFRIKKALYHVVMVTTAAVVEQYLLLILRRSYKGQPCLP